MNDLSGKELFIRFAACAFRKLLSIYVFGSFPFGFEGRMWEFLIIAYLLTSLSGHTIKSEMRSFKSNENIHKKEGGNESQRKHAAILRISNRQSIQILI